MRVGHPGAPEPILAERKPFLLRVDPELCGQLIPRVAEARLATSVDAYCDEGAFTLAESRAIFTAARAAGLAVRGHAGQFRFLPAISAQAAKSIPQTIRGWRMASTRNNLKEPTPSPKSQWSGRSAR